jgi:hypothetical protein
MRSPAIRANEEVQIEVAEMIEGEEAIVGAVGEVMAGEDTTRARARAMGTHMEEEVVQGEDLGIATARARALRTSIKTYRHIPRRLRTTILPT